MTSLKISLENYKFQIDQEERARKTCSLERIHTEKQNLKIMTKRNKDDVFQYSLKGTNIDTMGFPEEEEEKELKSLFKGIKAGTPRSGKKDIYPTPEHLQKHRRQEPKRHHNKIVKKINTLKSSEEK